MKKIIFMVTVAAMLFIACGNSAAPEGERGQDERLFGRGVLRPGFADWSNSEKRQDVAFYKSRYRPDGSEGAMVNFYHNRGNSEVDLLSYDWYTAKNTIYIQNIVYSMTQRPYGENVSYQYRIDGDTLTLSGGPTSGALAQFGGKYIYWDFDVWCDTIPGGCGP
jgi:hypothetical protein